MKIINYILDHELRTKEDLECVKKILKFQYEMISRIKVAREVGNVNSPIERITDTYPCKSWNTTYYIGSILESPQGYIVEYIDNIGPYGNSGCVLIYRNKEEAREERYVYWGFLDEKKPFIRGELEISQHGESGYYVKFPTLELIQDIDRLNVSKYDVNLDELLQDLLNKTDNLTPAEDLCEALGINNSKRFGK